MDFCVIKEKLIVELDGGQHLEQEEYDQDRTRFLEEQGYKVVRFWNNQVTKEMDKAILAIQYALEEIERGGAK